MDSKDYLNAKGGNVMDERCIVGGVRVASVLDTVNGGLYADPRLVGGGVDSCTFASVGSKLFGGSAECSNANEVLYKTSVVKSVGPSHDKQRCTIDFKQNMTAGEYTAYSEGVLDSAVVNSEEYRKLVDRMNWLLKQIAKVQSDIVEKDSSIKSLNEKIGENKEKVRKLISDATYNMTRRFSDDPKANLADCNREYDELSRQLQEASQFPRC